MNHFIWPNQFACSVVLDNAILPNSYNLQLGIEPHDAKTNVTLGCKKIKFLIDNFLHGSIFVEQDHPIVKVVDTLDNQIIKFPTDPWDYLIGTVLFNKFKSVTENHFSILFLHIDSAMGDHVQYTVTEESSFKIELKGDKWWNKDIPSCTNTSEKSWESLKLASSRQFVPKIIQGGLYNQNED